MRKHTARHATGVQTEINSFTIDLTLSSEDESSEGGSDACELKLSSVGESSEDDGDLLMMMWGAWMVAFMIGDDCLAKG